MLVCSKGTKGAGKPVVYCLLARATCVQRISRPQVLKLCSAVCKAQPQAQGTYYLNATGYRRGSTPPCSAAHMHNPFRRRPYLASLLQEHYTPLAS